ncbi:MAG: copper-binding protein [Rhodospirillaceae bacterium]|jgi:plastocyanin|nr:copper-binding protein [Rhodospirillaceae bacterium]MBT5770821.1 copper-binding protein [Rhodospirillaceae bacterium]MBT6404716.1 copper-binding protein [Rhodospirillaceae bacterium]MBT6537451.1 copper-binding protein [Rhodospirillaceae bacterium]MBT7366094.1 copper-binding protein [Rhodospirillaceae bacterium]
MLNRRNFVTAAMASAVAAVIRPVGALAEKGVTHDIAIRRFKFVPARLDVRTGDMIRWTNFDLAPHTATADDDGFDTGTLKKGQSQVVEVSEALSRTYHCAFHPHMKARINLV